MNEVNPKMDLNPYTLPEDYIMPGITRADIIPTSAKNQMNIIYLKERILQSIHADNNLLTQHIMTNTHNVESLAKVQEHPTRMREQISSQSGHELIAMGIRQALHYLGEITER